jgi:hypothetical protein
MPARALRTPRAVGRRSPVILSTRPIVVREPLASRIVSDGPVLSAVAACLLVVVSLSLASVFWTTPRPSHAPHAPHALHHRSHSITLHPPARPLPIPRLDTAYRTLGFLTSRGLRQPAQVLPLYGAHAPHRRHRFNYYTLSDSRAHLSVRLPVLFRNRDCTDEVACDELFGGEVVRVHGQDDDFTVTLY